MKLGILSTLWHRPQLTELFLDRLEHLKEELDCVPVVVGTEDMFKSDCEDRGITYLDFTNRPLGRKWNHGIRAFKDLDVTHIMILGSDDFVSDDFIRFQMEFSKDKDFTGCKDLYMFGANTKRRGFGQLFYFRYKGFLVGPGRVYSKRIVELMNYTPWNVNRNAGLDGSITKSVRLLGGTVKRGSFLMLDEGLFMTDIKSLVNISGIPGGAKPIEDNFEELLKQHLPEKEATNMIAYLKTTNAL